MGKLRAAIGASCAHGRPVPEHEDHPLGGGWKGWRDCHLEPDGILDFREGAGKREPGRAGTRAGGLE